MVGSSCILVETVQRLFWIYDDTRKLMGAGGDRQQYYKSKEELKGMKKPMYASMMAVSSFQ